MTAPAAVRGEEELLRPSKAAERVGWAVEELMGRLSREELVLANEWELRLRQSHLVAVRRLHAPR